MRKVRVDFSYVESDGSLREGEMFVPLSPSRSTTRQDTIDGKPVDTRVGPWASLSEPVEVELDDEEIAALRSLHSKGNQHWFFTVKEVK